MKIDFFAYRYDLPGFEYGSISHIKPEDIAISMKAYSQIDEIEAGLVFIDNDNRIWNAYYGKDNIGMSLILGPPRESVAFLHGFIDLLRGEESVFIFFYEYSKTIMKKNNLTKEILLTDLNMLRNIKKNPIKDNTIRFLFDDFKSQLLSASIMYIEFAKKLRKCLRDKKLDISDELRGKLIRSLAINEWEKCINQIKL